MARTIQIKTLLSANGVFLESAHMGDFAGFNISIKQKEDKLLTAAGIWDTWIDPKSGEKIESFAIITGEPPADILKAGHDRCPIFLSEISSQRWLDTLFKKGEGVDFLKSEREVTDFSFQKRSSIKSYNSQIKLFED